MESLSYNSETIEDVPINTAESLSVPHNPDVDAFWDFLSERGDDIKKEIEKGRDIENIIYSSFYNRNEQSYRPVGITTEGYQKSLEELCNNLDRKGIEHDGLGKQDGWFYCKTNGGYNENDDMLRVYFNVKPEYMSSVFRQVAEYCQLWKIPMDLKIPREGNQQTLSRMDKMVLYFNPNELENLRIILRNINKYNRDAFERNGIPRFTEEIEGLTGISMAQEPVGKESFGQLRCKILAEVYKENERSIKMGIPFTKENFQQNFRHWCTQCGVDPDRPAFNLRRAQEDTIY